MRRAFWHALRFYQRKLAGSRKIEGLVLDVGSGNSPHPRADVLAEKYLLDDSNRIWGRKPVISAPLVACDAEALPFADKTFDFSIASHLLEHVDRPDKVMDELSRVSKAGYIECPNADYDKLDSPPYHKWFVELEGKRIVFRQKDRAVFDAGIKELTHAALYSDSGFWAAFWRHVDRFFIRYTWEGSIDYKVEYLPLADGSPGSAERSVFDDPDWLRDRGFVVTDAEPEGATAEESVGQWLLELGWKGMARLARGRRPYPNIFELLVCPDDHAALERANEDGAGRAVELGCVRCGRTFPVVGGIPFVFPKREESRARREHQAGDLTQKP